jgi:hypothetical protein
MKMALRIVALLAAAGSILGLAVAAPEPKSLNVARLTPAGNMQKPADLDSWVFLGTSLGMGYNPGSFNAAQPGQFQVVLMEPNAYRHFVKYRSYAPGTMFMLAFYDSDRHKRSINQTGFTQADLTNFEIHLVDPALGKDGRAFYMFGAKDTEGHVMPPGNGCVRCHIDHGAHDGTFAQFYPTLRPLIPKEALERVRDREIR